MANTYSTVLLICKNKGNLNFWSKVSINDWLSVQNVTLPSTSVLNRKQKNMYAQQHLYSPSVWMLCFTAQKASTILIGQLLKDWEDTIHFVLQYGTFN